VESAVRCAVEYDGTAFCGFQRQPSVRTVAGSLEGAFAEIFGERVAVTGAGRTDAGVHASGQVISVRLPRPFPIERLPLALNAILPNDVSIREAAPVAADFSARFSARSRTYVYAIFCHPQRSALLARYAWQVHRRIDLEAMRAGSQHFLGERDFRSFCALPESGSTVRTVLAIDVARAGDLVRVEISADSFLHHMVRAIVGTLVECGQGKRDPSSVPRSLTALDRSTAGPNAPARGLYLAGVRYPDGYDSYRDPPLDGRRLSRVESGGCADLPAENR
jgi:tRNA pseudouridine38-40 synthase